MKLAKRFFYIALIIAVGAPSAQSKYLMSNQQMPTTKAKQYLNTYRPIYSKKCQNITEEMFKECGYYATIIIFSALTTKDYSTARSVAMEMWGSTGDKYSDAVGKFDTMYYVFDEPKGLNIMLTRQAVLAYTGDKLGQPADRSNILAGYLSSVSLTDIANGLKIPPRKPPFPGYPLNDQAWLDFMVRRLGKSEAQTAAAFKEKILTPLAKADHAISMKTTDIKPRRELWANAIVRTMDLQFSAEYVDYLKWQTPRS